MKLVAAILLSLSYTWIVNGQTPMSPCEAPNPPEWVRPDPLRDELKGPVKNVKLFSIFFAVSEKTGQVEKQDRYLANETTYPEGVGIGTGEGFINPDGEEISTTHSVCGANRKLKEFQFVNADGSGSHGNWTKETIWSMRGESAKQVLDLKLIAEREITYYPR